MIVTSQSEIDKLKALGAVARHILETCIDMCKPNATGKELEYVADGLFERYTVEPAPPTVGFPASICVSVNKCVAHGIPNDIPFAEGDVINVDVSLHKQGFWVDTGLSTTVGVPTAQHHALIQNTMLARTAMINTAKDGVSLKDLALTCRRIANRHNHSIVRKLGGHGTGDALHTTPHISNHPSEANTERLRAGQVIAIEPILTLRGEEIELQDDGWAYHTRTQGAQAEHTIIVPEHNQPPIFIT